MRAFALFAGTAALLAAIGAGVIIAEASSGLGIMPEDPAIQYATLPAHDPIAELNRKIQNGSAHLKFDPANGYVRPLLDALGIPVESQLAVFSKTSFQGNSVSPRNPRSIFFNDSVVVAWVRGEWTVEAAAQDPRQGVIFYQIYQRETARPVFQRQDDCLSCHLRDTGPGMIIRSVATARDGSVLQRLANYATDHSSPMPERWGGWYVTGKSGGMSHLGNITLDASATEIAPPRSPHELANLEAQMDTGAYLSKYSDIVALMVFEHQMHAINLITQAGWIARWAAFQPPVSLTPGANSSTQRVKEAAEELADYLLFANEPTLTGRVEGTSGFAEKFATQGPRDSHGRSLRQFDLERRMMRYPCSYMIYSPAFDRLPDDARAYVYQRMWAVLSGRERGKPFERLTALDRKSIVEILRETKPGLPEYFR